MLFIEIISSLIVDKQEMDRVVSLFFLFSNSIEGILDTLNVQPSSYYSLFFPPDIDAVKFQGMVDEKIFPTIPGVAPAIASTIILSVFRMFLQRFVFEVCFISPCL